MNSHRGRGAPRGRGRGGRSRSGFGDHNSQVPSIQQVIPGAPVSIVLKVDQSTGREVKGIVGELLTKGNHPRGIKVRLRDGRVGRVQRMATEEQVSAESGGMSGQNGEDGVSGASMDFSGGRYGDFRIDEPDEPSREAPSLADYVVVKDKGKSRRKGSQRSQDVAEEKAFEDGAESISVSCPVCGEFEGDEAAVAHHVESHFP